MDTIDVEATVVGWAVVHDFEMVEALLDFGLHVRQAEEARENSSNASCRPPSTMTAEADAAWARERQAEAYTEKVSRSSSHVHRCLRGDAV